MKGNAKQTPVAASGAAIDSKIILVFYLGALVAGELMTAFQDYTAGLALHTLILFLLLFHASLVSRRDQSLSRLLAALALAPLLRILSLSLPLWHFTTLEWMSIISIPLVIACIATISTLGLRAGDVGLTLGPAKKVPLQILIASIGVPLGTIEFIILRPSPWLSDYGIQSLAVALFALVGATGLSEELIFRGILQRCADDLARFYGIIYVSMIFAILHISFLSLADLLFVFAVAVLFAAIVKKTGTLLGVIAAHTLVNVMLYLVLPRYF